MELREIKQALRNGKYAWPGGYPLYFITLEGDALSFETVRKHWRDVCESFIIKGCRLNGWRIIGCEINWEDGALFCAESGDRIEEAYEGTPLKP
jgi:hypothetical protein